MARITLCCNLLLLLPASLFGAFDEKAFSDAIALRNQGEFDKASRALSTLIDQSSPTLEQQEKRNLEFEIERIRRIRQDYRLTQERLLEQLQRRIQDFTPDELERYEREGRLDVQVIDGQKVYVNSSASNLILRVPELRLRQKQRRADTMYRRLYNQMLQVKATESTTSSALVMPQDFAVTYTVLLKPNAVAAGKVVRAWLPFARYFPHQSDIYLLSSEPAEHVEAPPEHPHRTVYLERAAVQDHATTFSTSFIYRSWARNQTVDPAKVQPYRTDNPEYAYYLGERKPHIDFSNEELKRLAAEIVGGEANPYLAAKRIYDWIATNTIYQYAREYSTIENLAHYTFSRRAGDCGQHGMLFVALCRMAGIPARWTTGWETFNHRGHNMHDWCEFYVEPYGWLPADPDMAVNTMNHANDELTTAQQRELTDWLFGHMDNYRLTVNSDFSAPLFPAKDDFRSETVDFQRGEVESEGRNLYFDQWDYSMEIEKISAAKAQHVAAQVWPPEPAGLLPVTGFVDGVTTAPLPKPVDQVSSPSLTPAPASTDAPSSPTLTPTAAPADTPSSPTLTPAPAAPAASDPATTAPAAPDPATSAVPPLPPPAAAPPEPTPTPAPAPPADEVTSSSDAPKLGPDLATTETKSADAPATTESATAP